MSSLTPPARRSGLPSRNQAMTEETNQISAVLHPTDLTSSSEFAFAHALRYLRVTQEGQQWIANLYANVFSVEHRQQLF